LVLEGTLGFASDPVATIERIRRRSVSYVEAHPIEEGGIESPPKMA